MPDPTVPSINPTKLAKALSRKEEVTIIDIRSDESRNEWWIPESYHIPKLRPRFVENPELLKEYGVPEDKPIVLVCDRGISSVTATEALRTKGIPATSLEGGMKAWSLAWNTARVPISEGELIQFRRTGKGCLSYMHASGSEAIVIDASLPTEVYRDFAAENGWKIVATIDTHIHADHLSRTKKLSEEAGAKFYLPAQDRVSFDFIPVNEGDVIKIGSINITAFKTAGHTNESMCYLIGNEALITGDTLFTNTVGRPDLKSSNPSEAIERAHKLYQSIRRLRALSGDVLVLPCHTSKPIEFDGVPVSATLSHVVDSVKLLNLSEEEFVEKILQNIPDTPPNHLQIIAMNEAGTFPGGDVTDYEAGANRCAVG
jgi:glyoxylase-like metal-dependent hydrolase (beta-lactamase superfamily II)/rhodanese-related sulfurtransferase